ncbi:hypothetical protein SR42_09730 [Clostridium botulinum]|uniref:hypothetical protein n=1 Tax=Clostridium botulinum TaxID=1491 RepID=UPI0005978CB5|nr:hypothetical protein [Clostridium botulinum]KIL09236.1 hypothetical protein SR42_09730 [Clostridium botulinum]MBY6932935.1 hypothetical protein [Clostridium botulinum]NFL82271.1 hypothetical protein [Clostridium botulinum]NFN10784.1 hypothetical protein [Clostridium botulinum]NFO36083.1 hypothetical protein [Clostridium botulinum]
MKHNCKFCEGDRTIIETSEDTIVLDGNTITHHNWYGSTEYKINYCPICGKRLGEKASGRK